MRREANVRSSADEELDANFATCGQKFATRGQKRPDFSGVRIAQKL